MSATNSHRRTSYGERHVLQTLPKNIPNLTFGDVMGSGHFSHVYRGTYKGKSVAIKVIERGNEDLIKNEIDLLTELSGLRHIIQLLRVIPEPQFMLIFELIESVHSNTLLDEVQIDELQSILRCVLIALCGAHSKGIVHRDVKLSNILVNPNYTNAVLLDWGCASRITNSMGSRAGSRLCRPPEMLLGYKNYGTKGDIWAFGVLIFSILTDGTIPWRSRMNDDVIRKMVNYFDREKIEAVAQKLGLSMIQFDKKVTLKAKHSLEEAISSEFLDLAVPQLLDLMKWCLAIDPDDRPTAAEALRHSFFT